MDQSEITLKILVINDSRTQLKQCVQLLTRQNYSIKTFLNASAALEEISSGYRPDLVLTDIYMPEIDGWKLCRLLRSGEFSEMNNVPIILYSSTFTGADIEQISLDAGADAFLPYPFQEETLNKSIKELVSGRKHRRKPLVLIVDDDKDLCSIISMSFKENGYEVITAQTGEEAKKAFLQKRPDLVILDQHLPDAKGINLLSTFKAENNRAAVIMITGDPSPELAVELMTTGADAYIRKPFDIQYLLELVAKVRREYGLIRVEKLLDDRTRILREQNLVLKKTTERYEKIVKNSPEGYLLLETDLEISSVNESFLRLFNLHQKDLIGENLKKISEREGFSEIFKKFASFVIKISELPTRVKTEIEDEEKAYEVLFFPIEKPSKEILCIVRDISDKYKLERAKAILLKIAKEANSVEKLEELFKKIHTYLSELIDTTNFYIALLDQAKEQISFPYFVDVVDDYDGSPIPLGSGLTSIVIRRKQSLLLRNINAEDIKKNFGIDLVGQPSKCWLGVPLRIKDDVVGVIGIQSYDYENAYSYKDIELLEFCSEQIAMVIEKKRTEIALKNSEQLYKSIVENSPAGIFLINDDYQITFANNQFASILKVDKEKLIGKDFREFVAPESLEDITKNYLNRLGGKSVQDKYTFKGLNASGEVRNFHISVVLINNMQNKKNILAQLMDVTDQIKIQNELNKREREYRTVFENSGTGLCIIEKDLTMSRCNTTLTRMAGLSPDELLHSKSWLRFIDHKDKKKLLDFAKKFSEKEPSAPITSKIKGITLKGESRDILLHATYLPETEQTVASVVDVTNLSRMEQALQEQKEKLSVTLRSIGDGVITTDINGKIELINRSAEKLLGVTLEQYKGRDFHDLFKTFDTENNDPIDFPIESVLTGISFHENFNEIGLKTPDGKELIISGSCSPIHDRKSVIIGSVVVFRDITRQIKTENEMGQIEKIQSLGILAGGIAHDFNNNLAAILGNISLARLESENNSVLSEILRDAERECLRAKGLTQQLLTFAKGGAPIKEIASMKELLENSVSFNLRGSKVNYSLEIDENLYPVDVDASQISQVIGNLVINAQQAMPLGGTIKVIAKNTTLTKDQILPDLEPGDYVEVSIIDQGSGISRKNLKRIFDPYFTTKQKGSGLGLTTCFSIIRKHNGYITAKSELGKGSTFTFYLPAVKDQVTVSETITEKIETDTAKILVMDDDKSIRKSIQKLLSKFGYNVEVVPDGKTALQRYEQEKEQGTPFDLVIMDLTIPGGMGGAETIKELLKIDPKAKSIVFSGYSNDPVMAHYKDFGFSGVVTKPFSVQDLLKTIRKTLRSSDESRSD